MDDDAMLAEVPTSGRGLVSHCGRIASALGEGIADGKLPYEAGCICPQPPEYRAISWGIGRKCACKLAVITYRRSQASALAGSLVMEVEGKPPVALQAGDTFHPSRRFLNRGSGPECPQ